MSIRARTKILSLALILLLIAFKSFTEGTSSFPTRKSQLQLLLSRLEPAGYKFISITDSVWSPELTVFKEPCIYYIVPVSAEGGTEEYNRRVATTAGQHISFVYDGSNYGENQPRWMPIVHQNIYKVLRAAKFQVEFPAVYAVRFDDICKIASPIIEATKFNLKP